MRRSRARSRCSHSGGSRGRRGRRPSPTHSVVAGAQRERLKREPLDRAVGAEGALDALERAFDSGVEAGVADAGSGRSGAAVSAAAARRVACGGQNWHTDASPPVAISWRASMQTADEGASRAVASHAASAVIGAGGGGDAAAPTARGRRAAAATARRWRWRRCTTAGRRTHRPRVKSPATASIAAAFALPRAKTSTTDRRVTDDSLMRTSSMVTLAPAMRASRRSRLALRRRSMPSYASVCTKERAPSLRRWVGESGGYSREMVVRADAGRSS